MRTIRRKLSNIQLTYPLEKEAPLSQILFLDIETTGFTAKSSVLYLIGCAYYEKERWQTIQWSAASYEEEPEVVTAFFEFAKGRFTHLIHFNGNHFDLPFLLQKCAQYGLPYDFSAFTGIDLYQRTAPFQKFLHLPNGKQKTLEQFLELHRKDPFDGGQLIRLYHDYVKTKDETLYHMILCHNFDDLAGMFHILPMLSYSDLFSDQTKVKKVQANYYKDIDGRKHQELYMTLRLPAPLPKEVSYSVSGCYFAGSGTKGTLRVPLYEEELKYFYANYKDYYYLPAEDEAIHKSIASFVDKSHRVQATAHTCYTKKRSAYLPQWKDLFHPFFKRSYEDSALFFEITDSFRQDRKAFQTYAHHVLKMMADA